MSLIKSLASIDGGAPSIKTNMHFLKIGPVVQRTEIEKIKVQAGSA